MLRLKDKELQRKLDELSDGDFSISLKNVKDKELFHREDAVVCTVAFGKTVVEWSGVVKHKQFVAMFKKDELEEIPEYDPKKWNHWPEVTPPLNTLMRVEPKGGQWMCMKYVLNHSGEAVWAVVYNGEVDEPYQEQWEEGFSMRFRPWED